MGASSSKVEMGKGEAKAFIEKQISENKVVVFSKSYCPFCTKAKAALNDVKANFILIELDQRGDLDDNAIMDVLREMTGARTVCLVPELFLVVVTPIKGLE